VRTDERLDISLRRGGTSMRPVPGAEQIIRIVGPVTAELRAADQSVDRLRSTSLEVALVYLPPHDAEQEAPSAPAARAAAPGPRQHAERREPQTDGLPLTRLDVQAGAFRIDMQDGDVELMQATGGVDMKSSGGHVRGERLTYRDRDERVEVRGTAARAAVAYLGTSAERSEVQAQRLVLQLADGAPARLEAHAPEAGTSDVHLYRDDSSKPGQREWFAVTYQGRIVITDDLLQAGRVLVLRRLRTPGSATWDKPIILRSPTLRVVGRKLLASEDRDREIRRIVAEGGPQGTQDDVHFESGEGKRRLQIWGKRFDFDVVKKQAQLTGLPGRDVTMRRGNVPHSSYTRVTIDMKTNLPSAEGSSIVWRPR
jgi:hypothetical protein